MHIYHLHRTDNLGTKHHSNPTWILAEHLCIFSEKDMSAEEDQNNVIQKYLLR